MDWKRSHLPELWRGLLRHKRLLLVWDELHALSDPADLALRYTQAVIYFLLTALSMEKEQEGDDAEAMASMLHDTLKLIK